METVVLTFTNNDLALSMIKGRSGNSGGTAKYVKGKIKSEKILSVAKTIFLQEGYANLTIRNVAKKSGATVGNIQYHFPKKEVLLYSLIEDAVETFFRQFDDIEKKKNQSPEAKLKAFLQCIFDGFSREDKTKFFPELWALSNHDKTAAGLMFDVYLRARRILEGSIAEINKTLTKREVEDMAVYILSTIEGIMVFGGYEKPWAASVPRIRKYAIQNYLDLVKNANGSSKRKS